MEPFYDSYKFNETCVKEVSFGKKCLKIIKIIMSLGIKIIAPQMFQQTCWQHCD
jgi:hypothetical protein